MTENQREEVPFAHYAALFRAMDPARAAERLPFVRWNGEAFSLRLLGRTCRIRWPEYGLETDGALSRPAQTFLLRLLLGGSDLPREGEWKTFRELPWGEVYLAPYTGRVLRRAAACFGRDLERFRTAAERVGGIALSRGDAGYQFDFVGPYGLRLLVWEGDEEFPPSAQVLYTDNFGPGFAAEDRVVAAEILMERLREFF